MAMADVLAHLQKIPGAVKDAAERVDFSDGSPAQIFGRDVKTCTQIITEKGTSRVHFEIKLKPCQKKGSGEKVWRLCVKDRSTHGTFINGVRVDEKDKWRMLDVDDIIGLRKPGDHGYRGDFQVVYSADMTVDNSRTRDVSMSASPERRAGADPAGFNQQPLDEPPPVMPMVDSAMPHAHAEGDLSNRVANMEMNERNAMFGDMNGANGAPKPRAKARAKYIFIDELPLRRRLEVGDYEGAGHEVELFIKGLSPHVTEEVLWRHIKALGGRGVKEVLIPRSKGESKGCAYVEFVRPDLARHVRQHIHLAPKSSIPGPHPPAEGSMVCWFSESERICRGSRGVYQQNVLAKIFGHQSENIVSLKNNSGALRISMNGNGCANDHEKRLHLEVVFDEATPMVYENALEQFAALIERIHADLPMQPSPAAAPSPAWNNNLPDPSPRKGGKGGGHVEGIDIPDSADMPVVLYRKTRLATGMKSSVECHRVQGKKLHWSGGKQAAPDMGDWKPIPMRWGMESEIFFLLFHRGDQRTRVVVVSHDKPMEKWPMLGHESEPGKWSPMCRFTSFVFDGSTYIVAMEPDRGTMKVFHMPSPTAEWENVRTIQLDKPNDEGIVRTSKLTVFYMGKTPHFVCVDKRGRPDACTRVLKVSHPNEPWTVLGAPQLPPSSRVLPLYMRTHQPHEHEVFVLALDKQSGELSLHFLARRDPAKPWEKLHSTNVAPDTRYVSMYTPGLHEPILVAGSKRESSVKVMRVKLFDMIMHKTQNPYSMIHDHPMKKRSEMEEVSPLDLTMDLPSSTHPWVSAPCPQLPASSDAAMGGPVSGALHDGPGAVPSEKDIRLSYLAYRTVGRDRPTKIPEFHTSGLDLALNHFDDSSEWKVIPLRWGIKEETFVFLHHRTTGVLRMSIVDSGKPMSEWPMLTEKPEGMFSVDTRFTPFVLDDKTFVIALDKKTKVLKVYHMSAPNADWNVERTVPLDKPNEEKLLRSSKLKAFYVGKMPHVVNVDTSGKEPPVILRLSDAKGPWAVLGCPPIPPQCRLTPLYVRSRKAYDHEVFLMALDKSNGTLHLYFLARRDPHSPWEHVHQLPVPPDSRYAGVYASGWAEPYIITGSIIDGGMKLMKMNFLALIKEDHARPINQVTRLNPYKLITQIKGKSNKLGEFECWFPKDATMDLPASAHSWCTANCHELDGETLTADENDRKRRHRRHRSRSRDRGRPRRRRGSEHAHGDGHGPPPEEEASGSQFDGGMHGDDDGKGGKRGDRDRGGHRRPRSETREHKRRRKDDDEHGAPHSRDRRKRSRGREDRDRRRR